MEIVSACGKMIRRIFCQKLSPIASAASYWPHGMACSPQRKTSAT